MERIRLEIVIELLKVHIILKSFIIYSNIFIKLSRQVIIQYNKTFDDYYIFI